MNCCFVIAHRPQGLQHDERLQPEEALVVYVFDEKADLIRVGGDHYAHLVPAPFRPDNAAHRVGADFVGERPELLTGYFTLLLFPARNGGCLYEAFQKGGVEGHLGSFLYMFP